MLHLLIKHLPFGCEDLRKELESLCKLPELQSAMRDATAELCHEVNRGYSIALNDDTQPKWDDAPEWQRLSILKGVEAGPKPPHESHAAWMKQKLADGWRYGPDKDVENKLHPCIKPYNELHYKHRAKDYIFQSIVGVFHEAVSEPNSDDAVPSTSAEQSDKA